MPQAIVTGSNRGIGLEYCRQLISAGYSVTAICRQASDDLKQLDLRIVEGIDVGSDSCIEKLQTELKDTKIDLLINNAGVMFKSRINEPNWDGMRTQFEVNSMGPIRVAYALMENFNPNAKIAITTSRMGSMADNSSGSSYGYRMSKAAVNIAGVSLAKDLAEQKIAVALLHPGYVRTDMTGGNGLIDTKESVEGMIKLIDQLTLENSGTFWHTNGEELPW